MVSGSTRTRHALQSKTLLQNIALLLIVVSSTRHQYVNGHDSLVAALLRPTKFFSRFTTFTAFAFFLLARFGKEATVNSRWYNIVWDNAAVCCGATTILFLSSEGMAGLVYAFPSSAIVHLLLPMLTIGYWFLFREAEHADLGNVGASSLVPAVYIVFIDVAQYGCGLSIYPQLRVLYGSVGGMLLFSVGAYLGVLLVSATAFLVKAYTNAALNPGARPAGLEIGEAR